MARPEPVSPMPDWTDNYDKLVYNLIPRVIKHLGVATPEGMHVMMELIEVYDDILTNEPEMTQIIDHLWVGVEGHPDDTECTFNGCGQPEDKHRWLDK